MRARTLAASVLGSGLLVACAQAQLIPFWHSNKPAVVISSDREPSRQQQQRIQQQQPPLAGGPGIQMPPDAGDEPPNVSPGGDAVILSDVIGREKSINLFAGFTRDISRVSGRLENTSLNTTVLAPMNSAIRDLPWKPWEDPKQYETLGAKAYEGGDGADRANENLKRFVESHVVAASPWNEGEKTATLAGNEVWWERKDGKTFIQPGKVELESVVSKVSNGEVWILKGVINYAE